MTQCITACCVASPAMLQSHWGEGWAGFGRGGGGPALRTVCAVADTATIANDRGPMAPLSIAYSAAPAGADPPGSMQSAVRFVLYQTD